MTYLEAQTAYRAAVANVGYWYDQAASDRSAVKGYNEAVLACEAASTACDAAR